MNSLNQAIFGFCKKKKNVLTQEKQKADIKCLFFFSSDYSAYEHVVDYDWF